MLYSINTIAMEVLPMFNKHVHKRKLEAQAHYKEMVAKYSEDIANSITGTVSSYMGYYNLYKKPITLSVSVSNVDAVTEDTTSHLTDSDPLLKIMFGM